jgi:hypothetical protein
MRAYQGREPVELPSPPRTSGASVNPSPVQTPKLCTACRKDEHHAGKLVKGCSCPCNPREVH